MTSLAQIPPRKMERGSREIIRVTQRLSLTQSKHSYQLNERTEQAKPVTLARPLLSTGTAKHSAAVPSFT